MGQQPLQQPQDRITQGKAHDRGAHAGGLIERIGCEQLGFGHQHRDRGLLGGSKKLGEYRFTEGDHHQTPIAPAQPQPLGAVDQAQGDQQAQANPEAVGGHHHLPLWPAVGPDPRYKAKHHGRDGVGHIDARGQQGDQLGAGIQIKIEGPGGFGDGPLTGWCGGHPVLGDQKHHEHDVELVGQLAEELADPKFPEFRQGENT